MRSLQRGNLQAPRSKCVWSVTRHPISPRREQMGCLPLPWLQESFPIRPCCSTNPRSAPGPCRHSSRLVLGHDFKRESSLFEGYGLQPVHQLPDEGRALAPEGTSCGRLSSPQWLKPVHLDCKMYGLKAVPFIESRKHVNGNLPYFWVIPTISSVMTGSCV
jgi:hypothetical protein